MKKGSIVHCLHLMSNWLCGSVKQLSENKSFTQYNFYDWRGKFKYLRSKSYVNTGFSSSLTKILELYKKVSSQTIEKWIYFDSTDPLKQYQRLIMVNKWNLICGDYQRKIEKFAVKSYWFGSSNFWVLFGNLVSFTIL